MFGSGSFVHAPLVACSRCGAEYYASDGNRPDWRCADCRRSKILPLLKHCGLPMWALEIPGYYDGALFWTCESCGAWAHRFRAGHYLRARAERAIADGHLDPKLEIAV